MEPVESPRVFSNRYEVTHLIARGGMAQVFRARDRLLDRPVAIKVLFPELSVDRAFVERFRREAQAAANLSHPNIVPVFDWGEDNGTYFIVMEYVDGHPLSAYLRANGPQGPERVVDVGVRVAAALAYAHRHGVVHRDIKPGNMLVTSDGEIKVTDFGIARALNTEDSLTQTGAVMGTATYFSPEQAEGVGVDARSDIYSLGVVLYEMVAGRPPFQGDSPVAVAGKHVRDIPPDLRDLAPAVPAGLCSVIEKAMAKSPGMRYQTSDEVRADLIRFAEGRTVAADMEGAAATGIVDATTATKTQVPIDEKTQVTKRKVPLAEEPPDDEKKSARRLVWILLAVLVGLALVGLLVANAFGAFGNGTFAMPNVVGHSVQTAKTSLQAKGLVVTGTKLQATAKVPSGEVISTTPKAGTTVKKGDKIALTVSTGAPTTKVPVPNVLHTQLVDAEAVLANTSLKVKVLFVTSPTPRTTVVAESPMPATKVPVNSTVTLSVPKTSPTVTVPTVVGKTVAKASNILGAKGLSVGSTSSACSNTTNGLVTSTSPAPGTQVAKNTPVNLVVSTGHCTATVPNVVGETAAAAKNRLAGTGFTNVNVTTVSTKTPACTVPANGKVISQSPSATSTAATTAPVAIAVCKVPTTPTTPTTTTIPTTTTTPVHHHGGSSRGARGRRR